MKPLWLLLVLLSLPLALPATTIKWLVRPEYDRISYYSEDVLRCEKDGKIQLIDFEGATLLPMAVDSVTNYIEGYALVLEEVGRKYRVVGILAQKDNEYQRVDGTFFTERYSYCSEGFVSVADSKGKQGYVDVKGYPVIRCQYREARPFRKGWASVSLKEGEAHYIDRFGYTLKVDVKLTDATSFNEQGEALVGNYQKLLIINTKGSVVRKYTMKEGEDFPVRPYDYVYDEKLTPIELQRNLQPVADLSYSVFAEKGQMGLKRHGNVVALPQFDAIQEVVDGHFIVRKGNHWGVIKLVEGNFTATISPSEILAAPGQKAEECVYGLDVPQGLSNLILVFDNGDGKEQSVRLASNSHRFVPYVSGRAQSCTIHAKVMSDGLLLWQDEQTIPVKWMRVEIEVAQPCLVSEYADDKDLQRVRAVVTNRSSFPVEVHTAMEAMLSAASPNKVVTKSSPSETLGAGESITCVITFKVLEEERVRVAVSATNEGRQCGSNETLVTLKPFY